MMKIIKTGKWIEIDSTKKIKQEIYYKKIKIWHN